MKNERSQFWNAGVLIDEVHGEVSLTYYQIGSSDVLGVWLDIPTLEILNIHLEPSQSV